MPICTKPTELTVNKNSCTFVNYKDAQNDCIINEPNSVLWLNLPIVSLFQKFSKSYPKLMPKLKLHSTANLTN